MANELKVVIFNKSDFEWAEKYAAHGFIRIVNCTCNPNGIKPDRYLIIDYIKANPKWELSLQIHKYINVP